ncbi:MAG: hypothetical protein V3U79_07605 [Dehalococcoidia bacterium]
MADVNNEEQKAGESYYIGGDVGAGATVIMGKYITNIQQSFPQTADGQYLSQQFIALIEQIGNSVDLDSDTQELAMEKTQAVADAFGNAASDPSKLRKSLVDAKGFLSSGTGWAWGKMKDILTSEAARNTIGAISEVAAKGAIKAVIGIP